MDETKNKDPDLKFYESLKNAQPIAFLASFSFIIAVFSSSNSVLSGVYNNAIIAAIMFLISFGISLFNQLFPEKNDKDKTFISGGKYYFFAFGLLFLALIAYEFAKPLPQVSTITIYWVGIAIGIGFLVPVIKKRGKFTQTSYEKKWQYNFLSFFGYVTALSIIGIGAIPIFNMLTESKTAASVILLIQYSLVVSVIFSIILELTFIKKYYKFKNK